MNDLSKDDEQEIGEDIAPLPLKNSRRQRQQLRFAVEDDDDDEKEDKTTSTFQPPGRASRFLSIREPSLQLASASLLKLQQLHNLATNNQDGLSSDDISDELLAQIPFRIEIIPDRRDDLDLAESTLNKTRQKTKDTTGISSTLPSALTDVRRLEIIEEILKKLSQTNVIDEIRRANVVRYQLPKNTQMQKNVANRIEDLMGSDIVMLNDQIYMKNLCRRLNEKHQEKIHANFQRLATNGKHEG